MAASSPAWLTRRAEERKARCWGVSLAVGFEEGEGGCCGGVGGGGSEEDVWAVDGEAAVEAARRALRRDARVWEDVEDREVRSFACCRARKQARQM